MEYDKEKECADKDVLDFKLKIFTIQIVEKRVIQFAKRNRTANCHIFSIAPVKPEEVRTPNT